MRVLPVLAAACALGACAAPPTESAVIRAFADICLKTGPSFAGAPAAARAYGIADLTDTGYIRHGSSSGQGLGVQVLDSRECTVTLAAQGSGALDAEFVQAIKAHASKHALDAVPMRATIANEEFLFWHARSSGEAFSMAKISGWLIVAGGAPPAPPDPRVAGR